MEQERQKREAEKADFQSPNIPILCANNCGFFGSPATNDLCSKCYKDYFLSKSKASMETTLVIPPSLEPKQLSDEKPGGDDELTKPISSNGKGAASGESPLPTKKNPSRCSFCNKRVGLMGFECRCGEVFCSHHRYSDKHNCTFDYRAAGQDAIAKANPVVKTDKVEKI